VTPDGAEAGEEDVGDEEVGEDMADSGPTGTDIGRYRGIGGSL